MTLHWDDAAWDAVERLFADDQRAQLADRVEAVLDQLEADPNHRTMRMHRMQRPAVWAVLVHGSGQDWALLWEPRPVDGEPFIHYAGPSWV